MKFEDWISNIIEQKLKMKCTKIEIDNITKEIIDEYSQMKNISFVNKENEIVLVDLNEVLYINEYKKNMFMFYTHEGAYELFNKNIDISSLINENFIQMDKSILVNMTKVKKYNSFYGDVYFDDVIDESSIRVRVLFKSIEVVKRKLGKDKNIYNEDDTLYSPLSNNKKKYTLFH
ncbi:hypothetical protein BC351_00770 [Paenibacillus ferrarius]|uniref:HTH LytTR-type domain-containing protein n=1 Tax=Paenibacillus ferrarius TaxID=1469647 RepID=A0A1V4HSF9_9BACL|nr:LytTR family transcriptional regulator DNA-binding domain-containing protein [Paenibacillus ferrarius]OPH61806.1 hypothetical protein BC351_00770 [Paenibacillus ferrarius]